MLFFAYLRLSRTYAATSDGADQALQGWDMLHGNWLLRGWTMGDVTYYTTEIPEYALIELFRGLRGDVVHIAGAITYTLLVLAAGLLARGRATGRAGLIRLLVAAGIMLAPQFGNATHLLLSQPDHLGTQLPLLLIFLMLDRAPRRWYVPVAAGVALTGVVIADRVAVLDAVIPLAVVCAARVLLAVFPRPGRPGLRQRKSLASQWFELSLVAASLLSFVAATLVVRLISDLGGYQVTPVESLKLADMHNLGRHVVVTLEGILNIYGADFFHISQDAPFGPNLGGLPMAAGVALAAVHLVGLGLAVWGLFRAFRHFFDPPTWSPPSWPRRSSSTSPPTRSASFPPGCGTPGRSWPCCPSAPPWPGAWSPARWAGCHGGSSRRWRAPRLVSWPATWPGSATGRPSPRWRTTSRRSSRGWRRTTSPAGSAPMPRRT